MPRVRIFTDFSSSTNAMKDVIHSHGPPPEGWEYVDDDTYTHAIIINVPTPELLVPPERVVGLAHEPFIGFLTQRHPFLQITPQFVEYAQKYIGKYIIGAPLNAHPFCEGYSYLYHVPAPPSDYIPASIHANKPLFSMMVSHKQFAPGHSYRHVLANNLLKIPGFPVHIYGNGCSLLPNDPRVRGGFQSQEIMYIEYPFHICIENFKLSNYISEKIVNPLLYGTTPIYLGCTRIDDYFGPIIKLTGDVLKDIKLLYDIIQNPMEYKKQYKIDNCEVQRISSLSQNLPALFEVE